MLQIRALEVRYGKNRILHGIDLDMERRPLAVVGRNGMGKTTLCHAIMGMAPVIAGSVKLDGKGFVITGEDGRHALETCREGIFAVGDVRCGSVKRVAAAVGEGSTVVSVLHAYLARRREAVAQAAQ